MHESFTYTYVCALPVSLESVGQRMALDPPEPKLQMVMSQQLNAGNCTAALLQEHGALLTIFLSLSNGNIHCCVYVCVNPSVFVSPIVHVHSYSLGYTFYVGGSWQCFIFFPSCLFMRKGFIVSELIMYTRLSLNSEYCFLFPKY